MMTKNSLLIDVGGTNTELEFNNKIKIYENINFNSFDDLLKDYLKEHPVVPDALAIGAAGPIKDKVCKLINLPWLIDLEKIRKAFFPYLLENKTFLLNDLEAFAWYPRSLKKSSSEIISITEDIDWIDIGNYIVISVGTGLGAAMAFYSNKHNDYQIIATESGHGIRSMSNNKETWEDFLSGQGLVNLYNSLGDIKKSVTDTKELHTLAESNDTMAIEAIKVFFYNLGIFMQNMALIGNPQKGIYLSGGIIAVFYKFIDKYILIDSFRDSKKMKERLLDIPLYLIKDSSVLKGLRQL